MKRKQNQSVTLKIGLFSENYVISIFIFPYACVRACAWMRERMLAYKYGIISQNYVISIFKKPLRVRANGGQLLKIML